MGDYDYEKNGATYTTQRAPDPRIAAIVHAALGDARSVVNVGAGAGAYEPDDRYVVAVEPSPTMRAQRPRARVPAIDGVAQSLPLDDGAVDAAMAMLTIHHWEDASKGLRELRRVARGPVVILTFDGDLVDRFWLARYCPEMIAADRRRLPALSAIAGALGGRTEVAVVPIPNDCTDGFTEAFYARPERLADAAVRRCQSCWGFVSREIQARAAAALEADLASGAWDRTYGHLRAQPTYEGSLRLVVNRPGAP